MLHVLFLQIVSLIALPNFSYAIVNGTPTHYSEKPEVVRFLVTDEALLEKDLNLNLVGKLERCSGVAISSNQVLTAGHCLLNEQNQKFRTIILVQEKEDGKFDFKLANSSSTDFKNEPLPTYPSGPVPGCSPGEKPLFRSHTLDLGTISFNENTFSRWANLDLNAQIRNGDQVEYFGYGTHKSSFEATWPLSNISPNDLRKGKSNIVRMNDQRIAWISKPLSNFADHGDSGSPVFKNGKVIALISTVSEHCESEFGDDYGLMNTATLLKQLPDSAVLAE